MTINDLHINRFSSNKYLPFKVFVFGIVSAVILRITKKRWFRTGAIRGLVKDFNSINRDAIKLLNGLAKEQISKAEAIELSPKAEKTLKKFIVLFSHLEKRKFFGNVRVENAAERLLLNLYKLESEIRAIALANVNCDEQDSSLIEFASNISLGSLEV